MTNPALIELTRGNLVESVHAGAIAVVRANGEVVASVGEIAVPIFPRSAIKPLQALPLLETGAADHFGFGAPEIAIASGSHSGSPTHVAVVRSMLAAAGLDETALGCGVHEPMDGAAARDIIRAGGSPSSLHHNCSGKHAGMLATAVHLGEPTEGYWRPDHPVQVRIRRVLEEMTGVPLAASACGIDGCSVPNWAIPLAGLARAFVRLATGEGLAPERARLCTAIAEGCWARPDLVAGAGRLDTLTMQRLPRKVLTKGRRGGRVRGRDAGARTGICPQDFRRRQACCRWGRLGIDRSALSRGAQAEPAQRDQQLARAQGRRDPRVTGTGGDARAGQLISKDRRLSATLFIPLPIDEQHRHQRGEEHGAVDIGPLDEGEPDVEALR